MLTAFDWINVRQAFYLCTVLSALSCAAAAIRLLSLAGTRQYRPFLGLLATWFVVCVASVTIPVTSILYFRIYVYVTPISWLLYLFVSRDLYLGIFSKYRGIAFAGRWCLYGSAFLLFAGGFSSVWFSPSGFSNSLAFSVITLMDRSVLFGLSFFLILLVSVIVRYPISIQRNLVIHTLVFSSILLVQSILQAADQWTAFHYSTFWNTAAAALDAISLSAWVLMMSKAGENVNIRIRHYINPGMETQLLGQLDTLNGILLRAARK